MPLNKMHKQILLAMKKSRKRNFRASDFNKVVAASSVIHGKLNDLLDLKLVEREKSDKVVIWKLTAEGILKCNELEIEAEEEAQRMREAGLLEEEDEGEEEDDDEGEEDEDEVEE